MTLFLMSWWKWVYTQLILHGGCLDILEVKILVFQSCF